MDNETIDLRQIFLIIKKRIWIIFLAGVLGVALAGVFSFFVLEEEYQADVLLYIWQSQQDEGQDSVKYADLQLFTQLVNDYQELAKSRLVTGTVAEELGLPQSSINQLRSMITVGNKTNTRHLTIVVKNSDPVFAAAVANKVADVFSQVVVDKMGAGQVNIIDEAVVPGLPSSPNKPLNLMIGLILGLMLGVGLSFLLDFLDTSIRTTDDVENITHYTLLGVIPEFEIKEK